MVKRLQDKIAIITGGSRGNGKAIVNTYAQEGATVIIADIDYENAVKSANEIKEIGGNAMALHVDVTDYNSVKKMVEAVVSKYEKIDILVNNAGVIGRYDLLDIKVEEWERVIDINLKGTFLCSQTVAKEMSKQKSGVIINISSVNAESLNPTTIHYCVSKGGVNTLTKGLALALAEEGIRVNAIGPCVVKTDMSIDRLNNPEDRKALLSHIPMKRIAESEELTGAAVFLATEESSYVTGHILYVDGGWLTK